MSDLPDKAAERLMFELQKGLPLIVHPYASIAKKLEISEKAVVDQIKKWTDDGLIRRLGGVFDARRLGYKSLLCGVCVPLNEMDEAASLVIPHNGVTHCYQRGWPESLSTGLKEYLPIPPAPGLWFTFATPHTEFESELDKIKGALAKWKVIALPATRRFKIDVIFNPAKLSEKETFPGRTIPSQTNHDKIEFHEFSNLEKSIIRHLDKNISSSPTPFSDLANDLEIPTEILIETMKSWKDLGILRRIAIILRHKNIGMKANAMCVWNVADEDILRAGRSLASNTEVTHCYQRPANELFPFNLYAMIHTQDWESTRALFNRIAKTAGLKNGKMLCSVKEYKKTSMQYFKNS